MADSRLKKKLKKKILDWPSDLDPTRLVVPGGLIAKMRLKKGLADAEAGIRSKDVTPLKPYRYHTDKKTGKRIPVKKR